MWHFQKAIARSCVFILSSQQIDSICWFPFASEVQEDE